MRQKKKNMNIRRLTQMEPNRSANAHRILNQCAPKAMKICINAQQLLSANLRAGLRIVCFYSAVGRQMDETTETQLLLGRFICLISTENGYEFALLANTTCAALATAAAAMQTANARADNNVGVGHRFNDTYRRTDIHSK